MAAYAGAFVIRDALVKFGASEYGNQVSKARLVPERNVQTMRTLVPDGTLTDVDSASWTLELSGVQDWEDGGLADYFKDNAGSLVTAVIAPANDTGNVQATVEVRVFEVPFGGESGQWATFEVTFPVQGEPTWGTISA